MEQYINLLKTILDKGSKKEDRTGTGTISYFGHQMRFNLEKGFPIITTKKIHLKSIIVELLWFIKGDTNIRYLVDNNVRIWNEWPYKKFKNSNEYNNESMAEFIEKIKTNNNFKDKWGDLGPVYGKQWRDFEGVDQFDNLINMIQTNPDSRRLILSAWNPKEVKNMALPPCHTLVQFYVKDNKLSCQLYQRSADVFLGVPFNIASYSLLTYMIAQVCDLKVGDFIHTIGDAHIYLNHLDQVKEQLSRQPKKLPNIILNKNIKNIYDFKLEDFTLENYEAWPHIKAKVAV